MKKVLALVHGGLSSHTVRIVAIAKALREAGGYDILFSGTGPQMRRVESAGFEWVDTPIVSKDELYDRLAGRVVSIVFDRDNYEHYFNVEHELIRRHRPDIIVRDLFREFAGVAAKQPHTRCFDVFVQKAPLCPYYHFDFRPEALPDFFEIFPKGSLRPFARILEKRYRLSNSGYIRKKMRQLGLGKHISIDGVKPDLTLFPDSPLLFPLPEADKRSCRHIGPALYFDDDTPPVWLEDFKNDPRKKVLISMGTTGEHDQSDFFRQCFADNRYAVALYSNEQTEIGGFFGCERFNLHTVLPFCDAFVYHGGTGSTYMALKYRVPMLVLHDHFEQQVNGVELARRGLAINLRKKERSADNVRSAVDDLTKNQQWKARLAEFSAEIPFEGSEKRAVECIESAFNGFGKDETKV